MKVFDNVQDLQNVEILTNKVEDSDLLMAQVAQRIHPIGALIPWPQAKPGNENLPAGYIYLDGSTRLINDLPILSRIYGALYGVNLTNGTFTLPNLKTYEIDTYNLVSGALSNGGVLNTTVTMTGQSLSLVIKAGDKIDAVSSNLYSIDTLNTRGRFFVWATSGLTVATGQQVNISTDATWPSASGLIHHATCSLLTSCPENIVPTTYTVETRWGRLAGSGFLYSASGTLSIKHFKSIPYITRAG